MSKGPEYPHEDALTICSRLMRFLVGDEDIDDIDRLYIVGSLRRGKPKVRDIDLLCIGNRDIIEARINLLIINFNSIHIFPHISFYQSEVGICVYQYYISIHFSHLINNT